MKIKKISNDKLKVILNNYDLLEKNMDVDSFLSNSITSQDLFFEILDLAEEKYSFSLENHKAIVEAISLENNIFILTITKIKNEFKLNSSSDYFVYCFENMNRILSVYSWLNKNTYLYEWNQQYYLLSPTQSNITLLEYAKLINIPHFCDFILEHGKKIWEP